MSYNTKYIAEFSDIKGNEYTIYLKLKDYTGSTTNIICGADPLIIEMPDYEIFEPIKGIGATLSLISESDRQLIDLYTNDFKGWQIEIVKGSEIIFLGYIESELYNEPFNYASNYPVEVIANSGLGILDRLKYIQSDGSFYEGTATAYDIIKTVLDKTELAYTKINIITDLSLNSLAVPSTQSLLQFLVIDNANYIDEDGVAFDCSKVLRSILEPLNLTITTIGNEIFIYDSALLSSSSVDVKTFLYSETTCSNGTLTLTRNAKLYDSSFSISGAVNYLKITKNRYVKNVIEEVDFNKEYTGDIYANVWELKDDTITADDHGDNGNDEDGTSNKYWIDKIDGFTDYYINTTDALPNNNLAYYAGQKVAFAGGIKSQVYEDDILVGYQDDDKNFTNYIFVNNPFLDYYHGDKYYVPGTSIDYYIVDDYYGTSNKAAITKIAFSYSPESPVIKHSSLSKLRLKYTVNLLSTGYLEPFYQSGVTHDALIIRNIDTVDGAYGAFHQLVNIHFKDINGNLKYFVRLKGSENFTTTSPIPFSRDAVYEVVAYTGQADTTCWLYIENLNKVDRQESIMNRDFDTYFDIPLTFDKQYKMQVDFYNILYRLTNQSGRDYLGYYKSTSDYKETIPHFLYKDVHTVLVDNNGEEVDLSDEEIQFSLSDTYKTESLDTELLNYTAEELYVTDVAGINVNNNGSYDYISAAGSAGFSVGSLEDLKAEKMMKQMNDRSITISGSSTGIFNQLDILVLNTDSLWSNKKWMLKSYRNSYRLNECEIAITELK